ncbi:hypothetical protein VN12_20680 [Pirellula sp. SH-Sr6A]|uniref:hypothetical protein n=1 Tax=Pirellula sp. SH-Sr6A TaxID=1632865 RepID=UPI00078C03CD|nr:hypothetical protein [Pirellula sp. SH-Sr6A]AMV34552.1 hypothetical protein VN12_20680 [Pirellula sp. SH-Sr6A]
MRIKIHKWHTIESLKMVLKEVAFKDWKFRVWQVGQSFLIQVCFEAIDSKTSIPDTQFGRKWFIDRYATKSEIVQTAFNAVLTALEHEAREDFKYRGARIFAPHFDVDSLVHGCIELDVRTPPGVTA